MNGITVWEGIALGKAQIIKESLKEKVILDTRIQEENIQEEVDKFQRMLEKTDVFIESIKIQALRELGQEQSAIFQGHQMILKDTALVNEVVRLIKEERLDGVSAVVKTGQKLVKEFEKLESSYLRERAQDIKDVMDSILKIYQREEKKVEVGEPIIIIARDLSPSEVMGWNEYVAGILLEEGSVTSHSVMLAKAKGIPTIIGVGSMRNEIKEDDFLILDTKNQCFFCNPTQELIRKYQEKSQEWKKRENLRQKELSSWVKTVDGHEIHICGNVGSMEDAQWLWDHGINDIGLVRTEMLYMKGEHFPTEEEQFGFYKKIVEGMSGETVIRTLDIGGDKELSYYDLPKERNPFLGMRAIRFCLKERDLFKIQLRAILRASAFGKVKIMFPMISSLEELLEAKDILLEVKEELHKEGIPFEANLPVGMMVETPAAALSAEIFAPEVDFFSIGTNDLCQYTCAVDRTNQEVAYLYQPLHPAVMKLVEMVMDIGERFGVLVEVCGEIAGDRDVACLLVGMGVKTLSMSPSAIGLVGEKIGSTSYENMVKLWKSARGLRTGKEIRQLVKGEKE